MYTIFSKFYIFLQDAIMKYSEKPQLFREMLKRVALACYINILVCKIPGNGR